MNISLKKIEGIITIAIFAIIIVLAFNEPINSFIGLQPDSEITLLLKISVLATFLIMLLMPPFGTGAETEND